MSAKPVTLVSDTSSHENASQLEQEHVHDVYDHIAPHFSQTRYKPWPIVSAFLASIPSGWVGLDSGTGNGKYLPLPLDRPGESWTIGLDRSSNLLNFAKSAGGKSREVVLGDAMDCCWRSGAFDYAISIATIHHFSTPERRKWAIQALLRCLSPDHGRALIYVWATRQDELSKRSIPRASPPAHDELPYKVPRSIGKDVFVPWKLTPGAPRGDSKYHQNVNGKDEISSTASQQTRRTDFDRYYHMFDEGELRLLVKEAAADLGIGERAKANETLSGTAKSGTFLEFVQDDWERSNFYIELRLWTI
ncbi:S-adenosyl-L-methionine-dependent methyltransferase [Schizopora paradoxa]|uniref:S-adenosyl-L-methionine-dependent methyltransferase n=1 Tax=Schizopora paradoxa TaxID=27342 RepID=A0A0H2SA99_9AGAM|nr:S-adenosyl-L-methionine-dependent methyltransferase [Schizopora paradoxa]